jgi:hypothetical protein
MMTIYSPDGQVWDRTISLVNDPMVMTMQVIQGCDTGFAQYDHNCYYAGLRPMSWRDAQMECGEKGGQLVSLLNAEKTTFINKEMNGLDYWTGLNDIDIEGRYMWDSAGPAMDLGHYYLSWGANQPDDATHTKNCVAMMHMNNTAMWYNSACTNQKPYVCQKHAYDNDHGNGKNDLPRGMWRAEFMTTNGGEAGMMCRAAAHSQSDLQVFYGFGNDAFHDYPNLEPYFNMDNNRVVANVSNLHGMGSFDQVRLLKPDFQNLTAYTMTQRMKCSYDHVSMPFKCPAHYFSMLMAGTDDMGHPWHRIRAALCFNATMQAKNAAAAKKLFAGIKLPAKFPK